MPQRSELLKAMLEGFFANPFDPREAVLTDREGEPVAGVTIHHLNAALWGLNHIHLEEVRALVPGGGRKMMEILIERADRYCAVLAGTVKPLPAAAYGMKKMPQRKLMDWYRQFGFESETPRSPEIVRYPDPKHCGSREKYRLGDQGSMKLYRGTPYPEDEPRPRDFAGVFFSKDPEVASQYGDYVQVYEVGPQKLLHIDDPDTPVLVSGFADASDEETIVDLFMFPDEDWARYLRGMGYTGTRIGRDVFLAWPFKAELVERISAHEAARKEKVR